MTLYRQLLLFIFLLLALLFAGLWMVKLDQTRTFVIDQLTSHAQDTATSLGLSLSSLHKASDTPAMETMINAIFDRGYYQNIQVLALDEKILINRSLEMTIESVPAWFIKLITLEAPSRSALIMDGWKQAGTLVVKSHPGYAYQTLWNSAVATTLWFFGAALAASLVGGIGLQILLRPLAKVEKQALAISEREYTQQTHIPRTRELKRVVTAMNQMTGKIQEMFNKEASTAAALREKAYQDGLSGIGNRRYLEGQIKSKLAQPSSSSMHSFLLISLQGLETLNNTKGYEAGDTLIRDAAKIMQVSAGTLANSALGRLGGGDFALFLPSAGKITAQDITENILKNLQALGEAALTPAEKVATIGGISFQLPMDLGQLLTLADTALRSARETGQSSQIDLEMEVEDGHRMGKMQWQEVLNNTLSHKTITFYLQPTVSARNHGQLVHHEVLARIVDPSGNIFPAGMFIPLAERFGLMPQLDQAIIERVMEDAAHQFQGERLAINISPLSLTDTEFTTWLYSYLKQLPDNAPTLSFEFAEFRALQHLELLQDFALQIRRKNHRLGIDHFGQGMVQFGYLQSLRPDYVKIDRALTNELTTAQNDHYFFVNSLCNVAQSLGIEVMAEGVETVEQATVIEELRLDALQGYLIGKPKPLKKAAT